MLVAEQPIGRYITYTYQQTDKSQLAVNQKVDDLIDLIKIRIEGKAIEEVAAEFREKIFTLKFGFMKSAATHESGVSAYINSIDQKIDQDMQSVSHRNLLILRN